MTDNIHKYVRNKQGNRIGVILAVKNKNSDKVIITCSKVNTSMGDEFDRERGLGIAWDRWQTITRDNRPNKAPKSFEDQVLQFKVRCKKYFKTDNIVLPDFTQNKSSTMVEKAFESLKEELESFPIVANEDKTW